ncbi:putative iron-sulfur binding protein [Burkholderiales bacterium 8X]|nr:putative iron-sulfur binding protein [Burkholderiales bacterium 8X]
MSSSAFDLQATISRLFIYPVKSCAGVELPDVLLTETGFEFDRAWMVVDADGSYLTQRELPRMALIRPQMKHSEMVLRAPGMLALHIAFDRVEQPMRVRIWDDVVEAFDMGDIAAQWFSDFLQPGSSAKRLRMVRFDPEFQRLSSMKWTGGIEAPNQFADGFPVLVASEASLAELNLRLEAAGHAAVGMERFRPNLVLAGIEAHDEDRVELLHIATGEGEARLRNVKPCKRCPIPDVDPATGERGTAVGAALQSYRADARLDGAITFGVNTIVLQGVDQLLRRGQRVQANLRFD